MDDPGRLEFWAADAELLREICVCGHIVEKHELVGTEYARCTSYPGMCYCSGGVRVAGGVVETSARLSGSQTGTRFFRRQWYVGGESPLAGGIARAVESGVEFIWKISVCDLCGEERDSCNVGYLSLGGRGTFSWTARTPGDLVVVFCDLCRVEIEFESEGRYVIADGGAVSE